MNNFGYAFDLNLLVLKTLSGIDSMILQTMDEAKEKERKALEEYRKDYVEKFSRTVSIREFHFLYHLLVVFHSVIFWG